MDIAEEWPVFDSISLLSDFHSARQLCFSRTSTLCYLLKSLPTALRSVWL